MMVPEVPEAKNVSTFFCLLFFVECACAIMNNQKENLIHKPLSVMNGNFCDPLSGSLRPL